MRHSARRAVWIQAMVTGVLGCQHDAPQVGLERLPAVRQLRPRAAQHHVAPIVDALAGGHTVRRQVDQTAIGLRRLDKH